jgi:gas vesicle protein
MVNHDDGDENDTHGPRGSGASLLIGGLLIGLLVGGLLGAVVMLLVAPRSGKRTRAKLQRNGAEWREQAADALADAAAAAQDKARQITRDVSKAA